VVPSTFRTTSGNQVPTPGGLPVAEVNPAPDLKATPPNIPMPTIQPPAIDLSVPGAKSAAGQSDPLNKPSPMPMIFAPQTPGSPVLNTDQTPKVNGPDVIPPKEISLPPPLPPNPTPPTFDKK
jgi:hypothetical protein